MLIKNLALPEHAGLVDIRIEAGRFKEIEPSNTLEPIANEEIWDAAGRLALPPFIESHIHLDSVLTAGQPAWNESGTLFEGITRWSERKALLSIADVKERVRKVVLQQATYGVQYIRTHVDVTDPQLVALRALLELREELAPVATLQLVAFPQEGILSFPNGKELMIQAADLGVDAVGAIPHFEFTREYSVESLNFATELAAERGLLMDVHCDEIDDEASRGLETLATRALEYGIGEKVTASHTTAMHSYNNAYFVRLLRLLKLSKINFVANPMVNSHLQGRMDTYPKRRGVTRVKELLEAGINVSFGTDDIQDPWNPLGSGNMRDIVLNGLYVTQLMGINEINNSYQLVTTNAARTLNLTNYGIAVGNDANFVVMDAPNWRTALNLNAPVLRSYRRGELLFEATALKRTFGCALSELNQR